MCFLAVFKSSANLADFKSSAIGSKLLTYQSTTCYMSRSNDADIMRLHGAQAGCQIDLQDGDAV